jgi:GNS1/SUR4 family
MTTGHWEDVLKVRTAWLDTEDWAEKPFGTFEKMVAMSLTYLLIIWPLSVIMSKRPAPQKNWFTVAFNLVHNFIMAAYSLYAFIGTAAVLYRNWARVDFDAKVLFCDKNEDMLVDFDYWMYTFFLSKFYEWIDTIALIVLRGKPQFPPLETDKESGRTSIAWQKVLHVFHHTTTASIVWFVSQHHLSIGWSGALTNPIVHVFMYSYYMLADVWPGVRMFGPMITPIQLVQFVLCLSLLAAEIVWMFVDPQNCQSYVPGIFWLAFTYLVFFALFVKLYGDKKRQVAAARAAARAEQQKKKD